jgi:glycosyltransferase involved in cell wall biosynthesis
MIAPGHSPLVSVIVPAWQDERHAEAALRSVYEQDHEAVEVIVVDDRRYQRAGSAIRAYLEQEDVRRRFRRTIFLEESGHAGGASRAINRGLHESQGGYINILGEDDIFARQRFSRLLRACFDGGTEFAFSRVEPRADVAAPSSAWSGEADSIYSVQDDIEFFPTVGYALLKGQCAVSTGNLFFSRRLADAVDGWGVADRSDGWDFALRCLLLVEPVFVPEPLCLYRLGRASVVQRQSREARETESVLKDYLFLCRNRPVANPLAPSPAWGPFFDAFIEASRYGKYLTKP